MTGIEDMTNEELTQTYRKVFDLLNLDCADAKDVMYGRSLEREIKNRNGEISVKVNVEFPN